MQIIWEIRYKIAACVKLQKFCIYIKLKMIESRTRCKSINPIG